MKRSVFTLIMMALMSIATFAQSPDAINFQAVARDGAGTLLATQTIDVRISIYSGAGASTLEYQETHNVTTNAYGQFSLKIGEGAVVSGTFANLVWGSDEHHLQVELDNGSGYVDLGTNQLISVPYAMNARTAEGLVDPIWIENGGDIYYNNGYVGIGTTTPSAGLELNSAAGYGSAVSLNNTGGGNDWRLTSWTDGTFRLVKANGTTFSSIVVEPVDGYVGIGTSTPDQKLSVHASTGISYVRVSDGTSGPTSGLRMGMSGSGNAYIINDESGKTLSLGTQGTSHIRIDSNGHMGINELTPDMVLHIRQDIANRGFRIQHQTSTDYWDNGIGTSTFNYKFYYNGIFRADISSVDGAYVQSSDRALKTNIEGMEPVMDKVMQLEPSTYHYIDAKDAPFRSMGFIAQDIEVLFPDLVRNGDDGYKGVVYDGFAIISIKAIQELNNKVDAMQAEIDELRQMILEMKKNQE
ncbi:MAG: tail fiber domain-containing protein [Bacteroidales bacterium]|nr:tail fiber domain-containing protein [Bacteroidales bacterium]